MISVIVCSRLPREEDTHRRNVARTIGTAYEYLRVDNTRRPQRDLRGL